MILTTSGLVSSTRLGTIARRLWATPLDLTPKDKQILVGISWHCVSQTAAIARLLLTRGGRAIPCDNLEELLLQRLYPAPLGSFVSPRTTGPTSGRLFTDSWPDPVANAVALKHIAAVQRGDAKSLPLLTRVFLHSAGHTPWIAVAEFAQKEAETLHGRITFDQLGGVISAYEDSLTQELIRLQ